MQDVKLCSNKILQLLTGVRLAQVDMYNGCKTVILLAVICVIIIMVALCNRADHYIFMLFLLLLSSFFSSPNLRGLRLDVYHTLAHGVVLVRI